MVLNVPSNYVSWSWPKLPPRRGGPQLKESQVYPVQYGRRYAFLHCQWVAPGTTYGCGIILPSYGYLGSDMFASKFWIRSHLDELYHFFESLHIFTNKLGSDMFAYNCQIRSHLDELYHFFLSHPTFFYMSACLRTSMPVSCANPSTMMLIWPAQPLMTFTRPWKMPLGFKFMRMLTWVLRYYFAVKKYYKFPEASICIGSISTYTVGAQKGSNKIQPYFYS